MVLISSLSLQKEKRLYLVVESINVVVIGVFFATRTYCFKICLLVYHYE